MELKVKKQVEETVEVKTPAYYRDQYGNCCQINANGVLTVVRTSMICCWFPTQDIYYEKEINDLLSKGNKCSKPEFINAYDLALANIQAAVDNVDITMPVTEMPS